MARSGAAIHLTARRAAAVVATLMVMADLLMVKEGARESAREAASTVPCPQHPDSTAGRSLDGSGASHPAASVENEARVVVAAESTGAPTAPDRSRR